jgi:hypothetical protein
MTSQFKIFLNKINTSEKIILFFFALVPISFLFGNLSINLLFILISIIFLYEVLSTHQLKKSISPIFWVLIFFFISLVVNVFFSINPLNSLPRVIKILLMICFVIQLQKNIQKYPNEYEKIIFGTWTIIFLVVTFDVIFEMFFGFNTLGLQSIDPGRIASFFGTELVVGSYYLGFCLIVLSYVHTNYKDNKLLKLFLIVFIIIVSFLIGERSNFIKILLGISLFYIFTSDLNFKNLTIIAILMFVSIFSIMETSKATKERYSYFFNITSHCNVALQREPLYVLKAIGSSGDLTKKFCTIKDSLVYMYKASQYGAHYNVAYKIYKEFPIFGVGIKNFRYESNKDKYENIEYERTRHRQATHPHQIHLEILSETGTFGYLSFLIFILLSLFLSLKNYFKNKNVFQLSGIIFVLTSLIPMLPSGSFFTTFSSGIFWVNYALMIAYIKE